MLDVNKAVRSPGYPSAWLRPRRARSRSAGKIQDHCCSTMPIGFNSRSARDPSKISIDPLDLAKRRENITGPSYWVLIGHGPALL